MNLTQLAPKAAAFRKDGHWAVQGHSRSPILV